MRRRRLVALVTLAGTALLTLGGRALHRASPAPPATPRTPPRDPSDLARWPLLGSLEGDTHGLAVHAPGPRGALRVARLTSAPRGVRLNMIVTEDGLPRLRYYSPEFTADAV